jgi:anti-sigma regulatory factor (Ser/Thr protein kinase)
MHLDAAVRLDASTRQRGLDMAGSRPHWSHTTTLEATPISASEARSYVSHHLVDHRLVHLADPVRLVASELATNALVHAQTAFSVTLSADDHAVVLTVRDDSDSLPARRTAQLMDASGRGLELVDIVQYRLGRQGRSRLQGRLGILRHRLSEQQPGIA